MSSIFFLIMNFILYFYFIPNYPTLSTHLLIDQEFSYNKNFKSMSEGPY